MSFVSHFVASVREREIAFAVSVYEIRANRVGAS
jgi:hypothetical protein